MVGTVTNSEKGSFTASLRAVAMGVYGNVYVCSEEAAKQAGM